MGNLDAMSRQSSAFQETTYHLEILFGSHLHVALLEHSEAVYQTSKYH